MTGHQGGEDLVDHAGSGILEFRCIDECRYVRVQLKGARLSVLLHVAVLIYQAPIAGLCCCYHSD